ncbi:MAG: MBL fold metallo-hydrolase [Butyrivibrio sp.]|nr:MBL fold metallo-hydrolase [Butyrivibrio sp.]
MRIINLIENTEGKVSCINAHGLSFYIETKKHRLLVDLGPSADTIRNAEVLGVDLKAVDTVILSHGHYDHSGGIIPFAELNPSATIYMQKSAIGEFYSDNGEREDCERYRYIGIDKKIAGLPQVKLIEGDFAIDDELSLFTISERDEEVPFTNSRLKEKKEDSYIQDDFKHEHFLVIKDGNREVLVSGCAHNGIVNILKEYVRKYGKEPDTVISGFHLMKKTDYTDAEAKEIVRTAKELKKYNTIFYTCHCTGIAAFESMRSIMGSQLKYVHSGEEVNLRWRKTAPAGV